MTAAEATHDELIASIQSQLGPCEVGDLHSHMKRDVLFEVDASLDLLEVALALAEDVTQKVQPWIEKQLLRRLAPAQLDAWQKEKAKLQSAILAPWVLVQAATNHSKANSSEAN